ncbi:putative mitochondrial protein AtMg00310 [Silene latifolia]|uniref:putative mitochondrial protein AtMg00310 n=1 Tax=Silene latifolia TaxID=37657 RepID=UPI003D78AB93
MARFWWGSTKTERKLHWWSWDKLCQPKSLGGMGFRDLRVFNHYRLSKQLWRLITKPNYLVGRILQARYFKNDTIFEARRDHDPSYTWRSPWNAKPLLLDEIRWRVGNGNDIGVWECAWLPSKESNGVSSPNMEADPSMRVADFIDPMTAMWKEEMVR